jgi:transcriptional regulator with XRE-family HTH domain
MILELLRKEIKRSGVSRYEIGKATGIDQTTLFRLVRGGSLRAESIDKLLAYFGWTLVKKK